MSGPNFNFVQFLPTASASGSNTFQPGAAIFVEFEEFKLEAGLRPNINTARCSAVEFAKIGANPNVTGNLGWYFTSDPTAAPAQGHAAPAPDHVIAGVRLIDVDAGAVGQVAGASGGQLSIVEYILHFSDGRQKFIAPRGGILRRGVVNGTNAVSVDYASFEPNSELIDDCLAAMGIPDTPRPEGVDDLPEPFDLQWHGSHAPAELEKLLQTTGTVFCAQSDGTFAICALGVGDEPVIPAADLIHSITLPNIDHRGGSVIFTSAPTAILETETITGPNDDTWQYVVQDSSNTWTPLADDPDTLQGFDPVQLVQQQFAQLASAPADAAQKLKSQLYYCIALNEDNYPPAAMPIMQHLIEADGLAGPPVVRAQYALVNFLPTSQGSSVGSLYVTPNDACAIELAANGSVLQTAFRLGKYSQINTDSWIDTEKNFMPLPDGELLVRFTHERINIDDDGNATPVFFNVGFTLEAGGAITQMTDAEVEIALSDLSSDVFVINRPDWKPLCVDPDTNATPPQNGDEITAEARVLAASYLAGSNQPPRQIKARGFQPVELSGIVTGISWSQRDCTTTIEINHWYKPAAGGSLFHRGRTDHATDDPAFAQQLKQSPIRSAHGMSGSTQPSVSLPGSVAAPPVDGMYMVMCIVDGGAPGAQGIPCTFTYTIKTLDGAKTLAAALSPKASPARMLDTACVAANLGMAFYDQNSALTLGWCNEAWSQQNCPAT